VGKILVPDDEFGVQLLLHGLPGGLTRSPNDAKGEEAL